MDGRDKPGHDGKRPPRAMSAKIFGGAPCASRQKIYLCVRHIVICLRNERSKTMFHRHFDDYVRHGHGPGGFGRGPFGGWRGRHGGGFERSEGRMFDGGELRLVILALVAEKPRYGYEVIKELGERVGGEYSPSPGVVYPTLTMLEEMGYASASQDPQGRKLYTLTPEGEKILADNKAQIDAIFARFGESDEGRFAGFISVKRAMLNLRAALRLRLRGRAATPQQIQAIADALDAAAKAIERV